MQTCFKNAIQIYFSKLKITVNSKYTRKYKILYNEFFFHKYFICTMILFFTKFNQKNLNILTIFSLLVIIFIHWIYVKIIMDHNTLNKTNDKTCSDSCHYLWKFWKVKKFDYIITSKYFIFNFNDINPFVGAC